MKISFILVEPSTPENVEASARAMKTMGFKSLLLVNPCDHLSNPARWLAHGSENNWKKYSKKQASMIALLFFHDSLNESVILKKVISICCIHFAISFSQEKNN